MDAPIYPPAMEYVRAQPAPFDFGVDTVSLKELLSAPATREIVLKQVPAMEMAAKTMQLQTHISNFTLRDLVGQMVTAEQVEQIDQQLRALPRSAWPVL